MSVTETGYDQQLPELGWHQANAGLVLVYYGSHIIKQKQKPPVCIIAVDHIDRLSGFQPDTPSTHHCLL